MCNQYSALNTYANHSQASLSRRLLAWLFIGALALLFATPTPANNPEWQWQVVGVGPTFTTKALAAAYMRTLPDQYNRNALLTIERSLAFVTDNNETYEYSAPKIESTAGDWTYQNTSQGGAGSPSEAGIIANSLANTTSAPQCNPPSMTPDDGWALAPNNAGWGGKNQVENRHYTLHRFIYSQVTGCAEQPAAQNLRRSRSVSCPAG
jgi:hypothetical protein